MKPQYYENLKVGDVFTFSSVFTLENYRFGEKMGKKFPDLTLEEIPFRRAEERPAFAVRQLWDKRIFLRKIAPQQIVYSLGDEGSANEILEALSLVEYFRWYKDYQEWSNQNSPSFEIKNTLFRCLREEKIAKNPHYINLRIPKETNPRHIFVKGVLAMQELYQGRLDKLSWEKMFSWMKILSMQENLLWWIYSVDWPDWVPLSDRLLTITLFELGQKGFFSAIAELQKRPDTNQSLPYILLWEKKGIRVKFSSRYIQEDSTACQWFTETLLQDTKVRLKNEGIDPGLLRVRAKELQAIARAVPNPLCPSPQLEKVS